MGRCKDLLQSERGRELIGYLFFGILTTVVNIAVFMAMDAAGVHYLVATVIAWVAAVLFAYVTNKLFVFKSKHATRSAFLREMGLFFGARLLSLGIDEAGMYLLVEWLCLNKTMSKIGMNVVVIAFNYVLSKLVIFKAAKSGENGPAGHDIA